MGQAHPKDRCAYRGGNAGCDCRGGCRKHERDLGDVCSKDLKIVSPCSKDSDWAATQNVATVSPQLEESTDCSESLMGTQQILCAAILDNADEEARSEELIPEASPNHELQEPIQPA